MKSTRRQFLTQIGAATAGAAIGGGSLAAMAGETKIANRSRVVIARDDALLDGRPQEHTDLLIKLVAASMQKLTGETDAASAWRRLFSSKDRVGIKVNTLGLSTHPAVVDAIVAGLRSASVPAENILIWDRFDVELESAGFKLNKSVDKVRCRGTDAEQIGSGYGSKIEGSGRIGSCFSRIVTEQVDALITVPVLKDHNLAGVSLGMKNFYGAIHNPNKYHDQNCDPYIADVIEHRYIGRKLRLSICDGTRAQYNAGPARHPGFAWPFGGLIVSNDFVAADAVGAALLDKHRLAKGFKSLVEEKRPAKHIATAAERNLGTAELSRIESIEV